MHFLPPYSPDYNPIEQSFSAGEYERLMFHVFMVDHRLTVASQ